MRLVFPLMLILLIILLVGFLISNPTQRVDVIVGNAELPDVPLYLVALVSLTVGVAFTATVALIEGATIRLANRRLRREIQRLETENSFLRSQAAPSGAPRRGTGVAEARAEPRDAPSAGPEPASAPVYEPGDDEAEYGNV